MNMKTNPLLQKTWSVRACERGAWSVGSTLRRSDAPRLLLRTGMSALLAFLLSASTVCAQSGVSEDPSPSPIRWESAGRSTLPRSTLSTNTPSRLNRFTAGYRMGYQMSVKFKALGGFPALSDPGPATGTHQDHTYDDGYVVRDTRQVDDHYTWDWGFKSPSQVQPGQGTPYGSLLLHSSSSPATAVSREDNDPQHGFEISYARQIGLLRKWRWGLEGAFNYTDLTVRDNRTLNYIQTRTTDAYALDGLNPYLPPPAPPNTPYMGSPGGGYPGGGGPLIIDEPASRTVDQLPGGTAIAGERTLKASVKGLRFGPYLEAPLGKRWAVSLSGGLALAAVDTDFRFNESVTIADVPGTTVSHVGLTSHSDWMVGWYAAGTASYALSDSLDLFASVQYQDVGLYKQSANLKQAELDLSGNVFLSLGVSFSF